MGLPLQVFDLQAFGGISPPLPFPRADSGKRKESCGTEPPDKPRSTHVPLRKTSALERRLDSTGFPQLSTQLVQGLKASQVQQGSDGIRCNSAISTSTAKRDCQFHVSKERRKQPSVPLLRQYKA